MLSRMKIVSMVAMNARMAYPANALARILSNGVELSCILTPSGSGFLIACAVDQQVPENCSFLGLDGGIQIVYHKASTVFTRKFTYILGSVFDFL